MSLWVPAAKCDLKLPRKPDNFVYQYGPEFYNLLLSFSSATPNANIAILFAEGGWHEQVGFASSPGEPGGPLVESPKGSGKFVKKPGILEQKAEQIHGDTGWTTFAVQIGVDTGTIGGGEKEVPRDPAQPPAFPRQVEQVEEAVAWIKKWAEAFNGNKARVFLFGASAGGHICTMAAAKLNKAKPGYIKAVVSLSGPQDLKECGEKCVLGPAIGGGSPATWMPHIGKSLASALDTSGGILTQKNLEEWIKGELPAGEVKSRWETMSALWTPALHFDSTMCRIYFGHQEGDSVVPSTQSTTAYAAFQAGGITVMKNIAASGGHGWGQYGIAPEAIKNFCNAA